MSKKKRCTFQIMISFSILTWGCVKKGCSLNQITVCHHVAINADKSFDCTGMCKCFNSKTNYGHESLV